MLTANANGIDPRRLDRVASDLVTCSNDHDYTDEQKAVDSGLMDNFDILSCTDHLALDYYDGNTVTSLWNYAQHFAINDNSFGTTFGPSTPGAINLISGQTHAIGTFKTLDDAAGDLTKGDALLAPTNTIIGDPDPIYDDCGSPDQAGYEANGALDNHNIGDLLNKKGISWADSRAALRRPAWWATRRFAPSRSRSSQSRKPNSQADLGVLGASQPVHVLLALGQPAPPAADHACQGRQDRPGNASI